LVLNKETIFGLLDIFCKDALKNITFPWASNQRFSPTGMDQDATPTFLLQKWEMDQVEWTTFTKWWRSLMQNTTFTSLYTELTTTKD
jgi:hypothetical protein